MRGHLAVILIAFVVPCCYAAQRTANEPSSNIGAVIADGAKNPQLISDDTAYEVFFNTAAAPSSASDHELWVHRDKFARAQLSSDDVKIVQQVLASFCDKRSTLSEERKNAADPASVDAKWRALITETRADLQQKLSSVGYAQLQAHIQYLKSKIKIAAPMASN